MAVVVRVEGQEATAEPAQTLFRCAAGLGVHVPTSCMEQGKCRECLVEVLEGAELLEPPTAEEDHLAEPFRLSCRARVAAGEGTVSFRTMRRGTLRIVETSEEAGDQDASDPVLRRTSAGVQRDGAPLEAVDVSGPLLGVAIDVGTTTVVLRLHDLESGRLLATSSFENPQRFGGSDVMARIHYDGTHPGRLLQRTLLGYLSRALEALSVDAASILELVVVGNTTMRDLFFGLDVSSVGVSPYQSITEEEFEDGKRASTSLAAGVRKLHLPVHREARVYGPPLIGGHVGSDAAAGLLATGFAAGDGVCVFMDIGTNTELVVGNRKKLLAASCPAGPAFEGGRITHGMPALEGAVEHVHLVGDEIELDVIGGGAPTGLCGSALVDTLAELLRTGRMNEQGRFDDDFEGVFVLDRAVGIEISEADVNELAQAKGANVAGLLMVLEAYGARLDEIEKLYLAGGFARHLDLDSARRIGLIPAIEDERIVQVGNAALQGASMVLCSLEMRRELERLVKTIEQVQLEVQPGFFDAFVDGCQFVPVKGS